MCDGLEALYRAEIERLNAQIARTEAAAKQAVEQETARANAAEAEAGALRERLAAIALAARVEPVDAAYVPGAFVPAVGFDWTEGGQ
jgi:hypothetical protein